MLKTQNAKLGIVVCFLCVGGCLSPIRELDYEGILPGNPDQWWTLAHSYGSELSRKARLEIVSESPPVGGEPTYRSLGFIYEKPTDGEAISISISISKTNRGGTLLVEIMGNPESGNAGRIGEEAERVFRAMFPSSAFSLFVRPSSSFGVGP